MASQWDLMCLKCVDRLKSLRATKVKYYEYVFLFFVCEVVRNFVPVHKCLVVNGTKPVVWCLNM